MRSLRLIALLVTILVGAVAGTPEDTVTLANRLRSLRARQSLSQAEYKAIQTAYLNWIDSRVKSGTTTQTMNRELADAEAFTQPNKETDEPYGSHSGYLERVSMRSIRSARDLVVVEAGVFKGFGCSADVTAIVYQRHPWMRLAYLNAGPVGSQDAYFLSGIDVSERTSTGRRTIASGWVRANCTSTWNAKRIRIDQRTGAGVTNILIRDLWAQDGVGEAVRAEIKGDFATFRYNGAIGDGLLLSLPAIARYRIEGRTAVIAPPVALTRAGFIHEWLTMPESDAAAWSEPQALHAHASVATSIGTGGLEWERVANCGGSPAVWELAIRANETKALHVFRISGSRATDLRMIAVTDSVSLACVADDSLSLAEASTELPW